ncbi:MAG: response regulator transcription factor [Hyphomicrobiales bacterium]|nr:response regulator transcription factor [Hyphomicrobiales bacterium]
MSTHHFIIVDDHPLFRDALKLTLQQHFDDVRISEGGSLEDLTMMMDTSAGVDLILLDLTMPGVRGFSGLLYLRARSPDVPVIIVSGNENPSVMRRCIEYGASGFIPKSLDVKGIRDAVEAVLDGHIWAPAGIQLSDGLHSAVRDFSSKLASLTPQQVRVLMMLGEGLLNKQIAFQLGVSEATVKAHVSAILNKLEVDSRTQAVIAVNKIESFDAL